MGELNFNRRQCIKALCKLGFKLDNDRRGIHDKYKFPSHYKIPDGYRPFIMIPRHNELRVQRQIVKELLVIGGEELVNNFMRYL